MYIYVYIYMYIYVWIYIYIYMYIYIILYYSISSHISLYYRILSYIILFFVISLGNLERNGFWERINSWNGTERSFTERIIVGTERNGTERFIPDLCVQPSGKLSMSSLYTFRSSGCLPCIRWPSWGA